MEGRLLREKYFKIMSFEWSDKMLERDRLVDVETPNENKVIEEAKDTPVETLPAWVENKIAQGSVKKQAAKKIVDGIEADKTYKSYAELPFSMADIEGILHQYDIMAEDSIKDPKVRKQMSEDLREVVVDLQEILESYYSDILQYKAAKQGDYETSEDMRREVFAADNNRRNAHNGVVRSLMDLYRFCYGPFPNKKIKSLRDYGIYVDIKDRLFSERLLEQAWQEVKSKSEVRPGCDQIAAWIKIAVPGNRLVVLKSALRKIL